MCTLLFPKSTEKGEGKPTFFMAFLVLVERLLSVKNSRQNHNGTVSHLRQKKTNTCKTTSTLVVNDSNTESTRTLISHISDVTLTLLLLLAAIIIYNNKQAHTCKAVHS